MTSYDYEANAGNLYNKYETKNPLAQLLMDNFVASLIHFLKTVSPSSVHEVGCGEGYLTRIVSHYCSDILASDLSGSVIEKADSLTSHSSQSTVTFKKASIYDLKSAVDSRELIICCEVLEHLDDPLEALNVISNLAKPYAILSVPREPFFRMCNMLRFKYLKDFGNTPGHIQHWSSCSFIKMVEKKFNVIGISRPFPWTMLLIKTRK